MIQLSKPIRPLVLVILDGWGNAPSGPGNAISQANLPYFRSISASYPHTLLNASGVAVGLPAGEAGNSEVGHLNIGAGKVVYQDLPRIDAAIADNSFSENPVFIQSFVNTKLNNSSLHLMGMVGTGKAQSSIEHLYALLLAAKQNNLTKVYLHLFTDGRDSAPNSSLKVLTEIENTLKILGIGQIASIMGRYWAMDRDNQWDRTERAFNDLVLGEGNYASNLNSLIEASYAKGITDEFIEPALISTDGRTVNVVNDNDSLIFFNIRPDRARQLTRSFIDPNFSGFTRKKWPKNLFFACLTEYDPTFSVPVAFPRQKITEPLSRVLADYSLKQLHIAETVKFAHVTYFFDGAQESAYSMEERINIPSLKGVSYDRQPEMSAREITSYVLNKLTGEVYDFYVVNFANADMVAHTGSISATARACEIVDECLAKIGRETLLKGGAMLVVGDHGNAEEMLNPVTNQLHTEHTTNRVPFIVVAKEFLHSSTLEFPIGILADVTPTILDLLGIPKPDSIFGRDVLGIKLEKKQAID